MRSGTSTSPGRGYRRASNTPGTVAFRPVRALHQTDLSGPDALKPVEDAPDPDKGPGVLIDVKAAGVAFPDLLLSRGQYQVKPDPPFIPGTEVAGTVIEAADGVGFQPGDQVMAITFGGFAERAAANAGDDLPDAEVVQRRAGRRVHHELPHVALRADPPRAAAGGRDGARARRRRRRGHGRDPGDEGGRRQGDRRGLKRRQGARGARGGRGRGRAQRRRVAGRGEGADRRQRRGRGLRPGGRRPLPQQRSLARARGAAAGDRLHRGRDPHGGGEPAAAQERVRGRASAGARSCSAGPT